MYEFHKDWTLTSENAQLLSISRDDTLNLNQEKVGSSLEVISKIEDILNMNLIREALRQTISRNP